MYSKLVIEKTKAYVKCKLEGEGSGHDWWHILRVYKTAQHIAQRENANLHIVELASLLHDISDWKFNNGNSDIGVDLANKWLQNLDVDKNIIDSVCDIIATLSFKGGTVSSTQDTIEGMIVQDADRLDAIGAIGIARTFAYGGYKGSEIYNPNIKPQNYESFEEYKNSSSPTINHFYEKLLLLKDTMNTKTGKEVAIKRHEFMEHYLNEFFDEWNCIDYKKGP